MCAHTKLSRRLNFSVRGMEAIAEAVRKAGASVGYDQLKDEQVKVLCTFVEGRDVFVSLPTGFGKSLCYMLLPLVFDYLTVDSDRASDGKAIVVVVSPLIALMEDQVASYSAKGIKAAFIDCESDSDKKASVCEGAYQLVLFSPEALISNRRWRQMLREQPYASRLVALVIDEAHCVKKWYIFSV